MTLTSDAVKILDNMVGEDEELRRMVAEETRKLKIAQIIYDARTEAGLTQQELADRIGTRQSTISRLEDADYGSQSLTMLWRIAEGLGKDLNVQFVERGVLTSVAGSPSASYLRRRVDMTNHSSPTVQGELVSGWGVNDKFNTGRFDTPKPTGSSRPPLAKAA